MITQNFRLTKPFRQNLKRTAGTLRKHIPRLGERVHHQPEYLQFCMKSVHVIGSGQTRLFRSHGLATITGFIYHTFSPCVIKINCKTTIFYKLNYETTHVINCTVNRRLLTDECYKRLECYDQTSLVTFFECSKATFGAQCKHPKDKSVPSS